MSPILLYRAVRVEFHARKGRGSPVALKLYSRGGPAKGPRGLSLGSPPSGSRGGAEAWALATAAQVRA
jgi:hypothetical protein